MTDKPAQKIIGTSRKAAAQRRVLFKQAYMANGHNATQAAITVGYSQKTAYAIGHKLLHELEATGELAQAANLAAQGAKLHTRATLQEVARIGYNDPRRFYREDGSLKLPHEWDADMAAAVSSIEVDETFTGEGADRKLSMRTGKLKFWNKIEALDKAMRHAGLFEKDNRQLAPNLAIQVNLVEPNPLQQQAAGLGPVTVTLKQP